MPIMGKLKLVRVDERYRRRMSILRISPSSIRYVCLTFASTSTSAVQSSRTAR